ncbi:NAD(P)H-dependent oxidoreductase [Sinomicrobium weinanense]|uniref:NAD(P)H-dependent oxidoreductase n=1 Tax=Sinomicrobium weinanense TaxID=2842200 RepID=A0A926JRW0_9FLAO|nr:NAD(P)H-dependent oxidoreductase [Sinomicrobium weinanense]MBC9796137.1 NAD(P)H-dependent oxidoreductase [Sinomicrobium weinanense]MBU3121888.1 NAD(P)H-dependent oxidoreductase [Sinomicrobium weinanense]
MKTLVIIIHPELENSRVNKRWIEELKKYPDRYTVHDLYGQYPDEKIDIAKEQQLAETFDRIVFQFPFYWFNCPPLLKKWLDEVLVHGWAYGKGSPYKLAGKKIALGITAGVNKEDYHTSGRYKYTLQQLTAPFEITFDYIRASYQSLFAFYGAEHNGTADRIDKSAREYIRFIESL